MRRKSKAEGFDAPQRFSNDSLTAFGFAVEIRHYCTIFSGFIRMIRFANSIWVFPPSNINCPPSLSMSGGRRSLMVRPFLQHRCELPAGMPAWKFLGTERKYLTQKFAVLTKFWQTRNAVESKPRLYTSARCNKHCGGGYVWIRNDGYIALFGAHRRRRWGRQSLRFGAGAWAKHVV